MAKIFFIRSNKGLFLGRYSHLCKNLLVKVLND